MSDNRRVYRTIVRRSFSEMANLTASNSKRLCSLWVCVTSVVLPRIPSFTKTICHFRLATCSWARGIRSVSRMSGSPAKVTDRWPSLPGGSGVILNPPSWSPTLTCPMKLAIGIKSASKSKPSFLTRKVVGFTSIKATCLSLNACVS